MSGPTGNKDLDSGERRRSQLFRRESDRHYHSLYHYMDAGFAVCELIYDEAGKAFDFRYLDVNPAFERLTGLAVKRPVGRTIRELLADVELPELEIYERVVRTGVSERFTSTSPVSGKSYEVHAWREDEGRFALVFTDVTERMRMERALREADERFRALVSSTPDHLLIQDCDLRYTLVVNPQMGLTEQDMLGKTDYDILSVKDADRLTTIKRHLLQTGIPVHIEVPLTSPRGEQFFFEGSYVPKSDATGKIDGLIGYFLDVTKRKRAEQAMAQAYQLRRLALEAADLGTWDYRFDTGEVFWDERCRAMWGIPQGEKIGYAVAIAAIHAEDRAATELALEQALAGHDGGTYHREFRVVWPDGSVHWVASHGRVHFEGEGELRRAIHFVGVNRDITEDRRAAEALRASEAALKEADRRRNDFLAVLSHELRNPLAPIRNSLFLLDRTAPGSEQARRAKAVIDRQVEQLSRLIDDLLDVTRITRGKIRIQRLCFDLADLVRRTAEDHQSIFVGDGLEFHISAGEQPLMVNGDPARIAQAIGNLLCNAAKFTPAGGQVHLELTADGNLAMIRVRDTGIGISPEVLSRLFHPFEQADSTLDRNLGGLGLGLALVKGLVELHGGNVEAYSNGVHQGTEVIIRLPLENATTTSSMDGPTTQLRTRRRVLVIEDNVDAAETLREALEFWQHIVEVACNGPDGLSKARAFKPDVVLCDIGLPGMDGYQVARAFRADEALRSIYLVALTGYALPEDIEKAQAAGFNQHLAKPPSLDKLATIIATAREWRTTSATLPLQPEH
jgi:PAS domain S-box-containing protein